MIRLFPRLPMALLCVSLLTTAVTSARTSSAPGLKFSFGAENPSGYERVLPDTTYTQESGFGFEAGAGSAGFFSARVSEGNYRVTVKLGHHQQSTDTTIYAELRRLMVEGVKTEAGAFTTRSFIVNVRRPDLGGGRTVRLKDREKGMEAWAWDDRLTIEINGAHPGVATMDIEKVTMPTVYLLGDSTMCDQPREPFNSWGQMLTRFLRPDVAVANHAESGEAIASSLTAGRFEKVFSLITKGDYLLLQFGHNDMKSTESDALPTYAAALRSIVDETRRHGATPVLITSVSRRTFDDAGRRIVDSFRGYTQAVREVAREKNVALIDLQMSSATFYEALGPETSHLAFATMQEGTHHSDYGSYEIVKCVLEGIRAAKLDLAKHIVADFRGFDPAKPDLPAAFSLPKSPLATTAPPPGS
ncbi:MAG: rhamnogalacturonan acetylesterase [Vicinamibacterales bacterium]